MKALTQMMAAVTLAFLAFGCAQPVEPERKPNILIAISDDQSYPHASAYGSTFIDTPAFDRIANNGILFSNAFVTSPGCAPSRASMVLGRYPWQNEHAGTHASAWPGTFVTFPDLLEEAGYFVGYTGKGVGPFQHGIGGRDTNPAGYEYNEIRNDPPSRPGILPVDYAKNFAAFLDEKDPDEPFLFWYGGKEPHRAFDPGSGRRAGKRTADVQVPPFLPDTESVRSDLLDYALEIEWFDQHLARIITLLEERGELDNTLIIVTSDNGMAFPSAKAMSYEYGLHVPLAIAWGDRIEGGRVVDDLVSLLDVYPTLFEVLGLSPPTERPSAGKSMSEILLPHDAANQEPFREAVYAGRERHSSARWQNLGYPQRTIRTDRYLYVWNFYPERWLAGSPEKFDENGELVTAFHDVDQASSHSNIANSIVVDQREDPAIAPFFELSYGKRPQEELFDINRDPGCTTNLAYDPAHAATRSRLNRMLFEQLE
ncbi:MAG: sulfatase, partial [Gammaproteobacteria bacterium]|nr:sulfatase [Gammaproteobacteria bacterium]